MDWKTLRGKFLPSFDGINALAFLSACVAFYLSVSFSVEWFRYNGHTLTQSWLLAGTFITFMNILFEVGLGEILSSLTVKNKYQTLTKIQRKKLFESMAKPRWIGAFLMGTLGITLSLIIGAYSIYSIVGANYNEFVVAHSSDKKIETADPATMSKVYSNQIDSLTNLNKSDIAELDKLKLTVPSDTASAALYRTTHAQISKRMDELTTDIETRQNSLIDLQTKKALADAQAKSANAFNYGSFFSYVSTLTGFPVIGVQFISSAFPTFFLDLISFIGFSIALYRRPSHVGGRNGR